MPISSILTTGSGRRAIIPMLLLGICSAPYWIDTVSAAPPKLLNNNNKKQNPPTAVDDTFKVNKGSTNNALGVLSNDTDPDPGDTLTIKAVGTPNNGGKVTINGTRNGLVYTPNSGFAGNESFSYTIADSTGLTSTAMVTVDINSRPIAYPDIAETNEKTPVNINVLANDRDLDDVPLTITITQAPSNGTAIVQSDNSITYTPNAGYGGQDTLAYKVTDIDGDSAVTNVEIKVNCSGCVTDTTQPLQGYIVYFGPSPETAFDEISNSSVNTSQFNLEVPLITYNIIKDLGLPRGEQACFRVRAYSGTSLSDFSEAVCIII